MVPCGVADGEYHRLFTAMFMHYGVIHLLMNMWALWILGRALESWFGSLRFLAIYLVCGLGGNVAAYLFQPDALSAGASTAIFGLFSVLFVALRRMRLSTASVIPIIVINLVFTISVPGISIAGHLGGFLTGALVAIGMAYAPQRSRGQVQAATLIGAIALLGLLTLWQTGQLNA
jgi:membrane associated rhomboid family serine protease